MQGTVASFNEDGSGEVVLDSGRRAAFDATAFAVSGPRLPRSGRRARLDVEADGSVTAIRILTMRP